MTGGRTTQDSLLVEAWMKPEADGRLPREGRNVHRKLQIQQTLPWKIRRRARWRSQDRRSPVWRCGYDMAAAPPDPSLLECPICYVPYDNVFKTPLLLPCSHTFCMECLSRLCLFLHKSQEFPCPFCRTLAQIPPEGVPKMQPDLDVVAHLPPEMRTLQDVWADGSKLCWRQKKDSPEGKGSVVTLQLLATGGGPRPAPGGLITVRRTGCRAFFHSVWGIGITILTVGILLFTVLFLPIYLNQK